MLLAAAVCSLLRCAAPAPRSSHCQSLWRCTCWCQRCKVCERLHAALDACAAQWLGKLLALSGAFKRHKAFECVSILPCSSPGADGIELPGQGYSVCLEQSMWGGLAQLLYALHRRWSHWLHTMGTPRPIAANGRGASNMRTCCSPRCVSHPLRRASLPRVKLQESNCAQQCAHKSAGDERISQPQHPASQVTMPLHTQSDGLSCCFSVSSLSAGCWHPRIMLHRHAGPQQLWRS